jgi:hypothetical protein
LFDNSPHKRDEVDGLQTREEIDLYIKRERAREVRTRREEAEAEAHAAEARVRHLNLDYVLRIVLAVLAVGIGITVIIGAAGEPALLKLSLAASSAWAAIAAGAIRVLRPKGKKAG